MEQYIYRPYNKNEYVKRSASTNKIIEKAVDYAASVLNEVWECDTLYFWRSVDSNDVYCWMQEDAPALAESIRTHNLKQTFHRRLSERLHLWIDAESMVGLMKLPDLHAILAAGSNEAQIDAVKQYMDGHSRTYSDRDRWQYGQGWDDEDDYADEWDDSDEDEGYGDLATEIVAGEALRIIAGRQQNQSQQAGKSSKKRFIETSDTCAIIDEVRTSLASSTSFYVIDSNSLPSCLRGKSREKRCIVVRVSDQWLDDPSHLATDGAIHHRFVRVAGNVAPISVFAIGINAVWLDAQKATDVFRMMRCQVPILYVGSTKSAFIAHLYRHFADLSNLCDRTINADQCSDEVVLREFETRFSNGTVVAPAVKRNMVDLT